MNSKVSYNGVRYEKNTKCLFKTVDDFAGAGHEVAGAGDMFDEVRVVFKAVADHIGIDQFDKKFVVFFFQGAFFQMHLGDMEQAGIPYKEGNEQKNGEACQGQPVDPAAIGPGGIVEFIEYPLAYFADQFIAVFGKTRHPLMSPGYISFKGEMEESATTFWQDR